jgi:hypothetical protein
LLAPILYQLAIDKYLAHPCQVLEGVAVVEHQIGVLADLDAAQVDSSLYPGCLYSST